MSDNFPNIETKTVYEISDMATSSSVSFAKIGFNEKPEADFLPDMPMKQAVKIKVVKVRKISFSSELFE